MANRHPFVLRELVMRDGVPVSKGEARLLVLCRPAGRVACILAGSGHRSADDCLPHATAHEVYSLRLRFGGVPCLSLVGCGLHGCFVHHDRSMTESLSSPAPLRVISWELLAGVNWFAATHSSIWVAQLERGVSGSDHALECVLKSPILGWVWWH
jgi:hypothetical protein